MVAAHTARLDSTAINIIRVTGTRNGDQYQVFEIGIAFYEFANFNYTLFFANFRPSIDEGLSFFTLRV